MARFILPTLPVPVVSAVVDTEKSLCGSHKVLYEIHLLLPAPAAELALESPIAPLVLPDFDLMDILLRCPDAAPATALSSIAFTGGS